MSLLRNLGNLFYYPLWDLVIHNGYWNYQLLINQQKRIFLCTDLYLEFSNLSEAGINMSDELLLKFSLILLAFTPKAGLKEFESCMSIWFDICTSVRQRNIA